MAVWKADCFREGEFFTTGAWSCTSPRRGTVVEFEGGSPEGRLPEGKFHIFSVNSATSTIIALEVRS